jgi:hypothetical protein
MRDLRADTVSNLHELLARRIAVLYAFWEVHARGGTGGPAAAAPLRRAAAWKERLPGSPPREARLLLRGARALEGR